MAQPEMRYVSVLISYPVTTFLLYKGAAWAFGFETAPWMALIAILIGHIFSLIYIVRGVMKPK